MPGSCSNSSLVDRPAGLTEVDRAWRAGGGEQSRGPAAGESGRWGTAQAAAAAAWRQRCGVGRQGPVRIAAWP